jgi:hypothetical protein
MQLAKNAFKQFSHELALQQSNISPEMSDHLSESKQKTLRRDTLQGSTQRA